jgi:hypothetical protein
VHFREFAVCVRLTQTERHITFLDDDDDDDDDAVRDHTAITNGVSPPENTKEMEECEIPHSPTRLYL